MYKMWTMSGDLAAKGPTRKGFNNKPGSQLAERSQPSLSAHEEQEH